ncbi:MAG: hypothetical protein QOK19_326 [Solirubrobacteraceae bacterium]|jgi:hypothetical protein|nr:hypothetical protein [Solirubrobacterales bacterium]MEA2214765.1 hypothetical protein [Solirubrobacteraceae bacterium]
MLAYVFWHRAAGGVDVEDYEQALSRFHRSLAHRPPCGLLGSVTLRAEQLPWLPAAGAGDSGGYEDWYLVENWSAVGVLELAAVSRGHQTAHGEAARRMGQGAGAIYKRLEGEAAPGDARLAVWVTRPRGQRDPTIAELLDDGVGPHDGALWQRTLVLGPAPELCLLHSAAELPPGTGLAESRLPPGWQAASAGRERLAG